MSTDTALRSISGGPARPICERPPGEDDALLRAMETAIRQEVFDQIGTYIVGGGCFCATAALKALRKHQAGE